MKQEYSKQEKVYVIPTHPYAFRGGEPSEIIGVKMGQPNEKSDPRLVYEVEYSDGVRDYIPVSDIGVHYKLLTFEGVKKHFAEEKKEQKKEEKKIACTRYKPDPKEKYPLDGTCLNCGRSVWLHLTPPSHPPRFCSI